VSVSNREDPDGCSMLLLLKRKYAPTQGNNVGRKNAYAMQKKVRKSKGGAKVQRPILFGNVLRGARCQFIGFKKTAHVSQRVQRCELVDDLRVLLV
jgi:hypothetical protein